MSRVHVALAYRSDAQLDPITICRAEDRQTVRSIVAVPLAQVGKRGVLPVTCPRCLAFVERMGAARMPGDAMRKAVLSAAARGNLDVLLERWSERGGAVWAAAAAYALAYRDGLTSTLDVVGPLKACASAMHAFRALRARAHREAA